MCERAFISEMWTKRLWQQHGVYVLLTSFGPTRVHVCFGLKLLRRLIVCVLEGRLSPELLRSTLACTCWPFFRKGRRGTKNKLKLTKNYHKMCPIRSRVVSRWFHFLFSEFIVYVTLVLFVIVLFGIIYRCKFIWVIVTANIYYISVYSNFLCWVLDSDWSIMINVQCNPTTRLLRSWFILL